MPVINFPEKASKVDIVVSTVVEINDAFAALEDVSNRLFGIQKIVQGLSENFYNGFGDAFDLIELSDEAIEEYKDEYEFWQPAATRHGIEMDALVEHIGRAKAVFDATHTSLLSGDRNHSVARHTELHRKAEWSAAVEAFKAASLEIETTTTDQRPAVVAEKYGEALKKLIRTRAPDLDALREKIRILRAAIGEQDHGLFTQLMADFDKLN